jgi:hypothetical protein
MGTGGWEGGMVVKVRTASLLAAPRHLFHQGPGCIAVLHCLASDYCWALPGQLAYPVTTHVRCSWPAQVRYRDGQAVSFRGEKFIVEVR